MEQHPLGAQSAAGCCPGWGPFSRFPGESRRGGEPRWYDSGAMNYTPVSTDRERVDGGGKGRQWFALVQVRCVRCNRLNHSWAVFSDGSARPFGPVHIDELHAVV